MTHPLTGSTINGLEMNILGSRPLSMKGQDIKQLAKGRRQSSLAEFLEFLGQNKKWWLLPILLVVLILGALVFLGGSGAAPFIYTLF